MRVPRFLLIGGTLAVLAHAAPADPEIVPRSGVTFEQLTLKAIPPYRARQRPDGRYETLRRPDLVAELRLVTGLALNERGADLLPAPTPRISCRYETYSVVDDAWFRDFNDWFRDELRALDLKFRQQVWDCDDFSLSLNAFADLALLLARDHPPPQLIGRLIVEQANPWGGTPAGGLHEVVIFRSQSAWHVVEPQTHTVTTLQSYPNRGFIQEILFN